MLILCINFKFMKTYNLLQLLEKEKENLCQEIDWKWVVSANRRYPVPMLLRMGVPISPCHGANSFRNKNFMQPMRRLSMDWRGSSFFFSFWVGGRWGGIILILFWDTANVFPSSSQGVPNQTSKGSSRSWCVPQDVPNSTKLLSDILCSKLNIYLNNEDGPTESSFREWRMFF
jgi:hypothetical protein